VILVKLYKKSKLKK